MKKVQYLFYSHVAFVFMAGCASTWTEQVQLRVQRYHLEGSKSEYLAYLPLGDSCEFREAACNSGTKRPTLVFVHGLGGSKYLWKDIANIMLTQHGYPIVLVDLLGHGDSAKPLNADYSPSKQGHRLAQLLAGLDLLCGNEVVLIGQSYGAVSSLEAALQFPDPKTKPFRKLLGVVSVSAPALYYPRLEESPSTLDNLQKESAIRDILQLLLHDRFYERTILESSQWRRGRITDSDRREIHNQYRSLAARKSLKHATLHMIKELKGHREQQNRFASIDCPVLTIGGKLDGIVPSQVQTDLANQFHQKPVLLEKCGHAVAQDQPELLLGLLVDFVGSLGGS